MSYIDTKYYCGTFKFKYFDDDIPEDHLVRFVVTFVQSFLKFLN